MKTSFLIIALFLSITSHAQKDKRAHAFAGAGISLTAYHLLYKANHNPWRSRIGAILVTALAAGAKEYYDYASGKGTADRNDFFATLKGCVVLTLTF